MALQLIVEYGARDDSLSCFAFVNFWIHKNSFLTIILSNNTLIPVLDTKY